MIKKWLSKISRTLWFMLGIIMMGIAYVGVVTPGIPWSTPTVVAAYCFARSNDAWHTWLMNHKLFGAFLRNWSSHRVFPLRGKWMMVVTMDVSIIMLWIMTQNIWLVISVGAIMIAVSVYTWRYPETVAEAEQRTQRGEKLGWLGRW